ncbi:MAG TPA: GAF domain-containing protein, partial [Casimicrobiaceae bacterium]
PESGNALKQRSRIVAPLIAQNALLGFLYADLDGAFGRLHDADRDLLAMLASQAAVALDNAQWSQDLEQKVATRTEELRASNALMEQSAAELAIINAVQQALASELSLQGIYKVVGEKLREVFHGAYVSIRTYDPRTDIMQFPWSFYAGKEYTGTPPEPVGDDGFGAQVIRTRRTLLIDEDLEGQSERYRARMLIDAPSPMTQLMVPLVAGDEVRGILVLCDMEREHAYAESDVRLLETLASSMSVALENARHFDKTQSLLKETEQRAAELAIINSVQEGLASKLDMQAIYDLVGDKLGEVLHSQDIDIRLYEPATQQVFFPYLKDRGQRISAPPVPLGGVSKVVIETGQTWLVNEDIARRMAEVGSVSIPGTQMEKSFVAVPIVAGGRVVGLVGVGDYEREHAFDTSAVRLLQTVVSAMSVALENARLFDETQRLLKETEQRAAELAVINSIQEGMAAELDFQAIVNLVGDKLREVLHTEDIGIRWFDAEARVVHYLYEFEHGERLTIPSAPPRVSSWETLTSRRTPLVLNTVAEMIANGTVPGTDTGKSSVSVPIIGSDRVIGAIMVESHEREYAYGESDVRLLTTVASSMGVALENAR